MEKIQYLDVAPYNAAGGGTTAEHAILQQAIDDYAGEAPSGTPFGGGIVSTQHLAFNIQAQVTVKAMVMWQGYPDGRMPAPQASDGEKPTTFGYGVPNSSVSIDFGKGDTNLDASNAAIVVKHRAAGVKGHLFYAPGQLSTDSVWSVYPPVIGFDGGDLNSNVEDCHFFNNYIWIKTDDDAGNDVAMGNSLFSNLSGTPLYRAIWLERTFESLFIDHTNFYKFWSPGQPSSDLIDYIRESSVGFYLENTDGLHISHTRSWGIGTTFHLVAGATGSTWANVTDFSCDSNHRPIIIDDVDSARFMCGQIIGATTEPLNHSGYAAIDVTANVAFVGARATFIGIDFFNIMHCVHVAASIGQFTFIGLSAKTDTADTGPGRYDGNNVRGALMIDEGNGANVRLDASARGLQQQWEHIFGPGETLMVDGITLPNRGTEVSQLGIEDRNFWTNKTDITNITDGLQFDMTNASIVDSDYTISSDVSAEGIGVFECVLNQTFSEDVSSACEFTISFVDASGNEITRMFDSGFVPHYEQGYKFIFPFFTKPGDATTLRIRFGRQLTGTATIEITDMKIWKPSREYITNTFIDSVYGTERFATTNGKTLYMEGSNKVIVGTSVPTAGTWQTGDKVRVLGGTDFQYNGSAWV